MDDALQPFALAVERCGFHALRALAGSVDGRVAALFERSFYVDIAGSFACVGTRELAVGSLSVVTSAPASTVWSASGLGLGDAVEVRNGVLHVGRRFAFPLADAMVWRPEPVLGGWDGASIGRGLAALRTAGRAHVPDEGLGVYVDPAARPRPCQAAAWRARGPVRKLRIWLDASFAGAVPAAGALAPSLHLLAGLGPGLTPSGSDFLGGAMLALRALGHPGLVARLWPQLRRAARADGNPIALAHLEAAADGGGGAALHRAIAGIMRGDAAAAPDIVGTVAAIGHTSGWDALAGAVLALDAWREVQAHRPGSTSPSRG